ncbi:histamine N-methyltransferase-like [Synchiropus picturatus]
MSAMDDDDDDPKTCYTDDLVKTFKFYLEKSGEHEAILETMQKVLPDDFERMVEGKNNLDILGIGSGGGQVDIQILNLLQEFCPGVSISSDIVEGSCELVEDFKELVKKTPSLKDVPFTWHVMHSEGYVKRGRAKAQKDIKKFDFIHMVQMIYYVKNLDDSLLFYRRALKPNGRIMIIIEADGGGWDTLWTTFKKELLVGPNEEYRCSRDIVASLKKHGMEFEEHDIPNSFEVTECFDGNDSTGNSLLNYMTNRKNFQEAFSEEVKKEMLKVIQYKCSTEKDGKIFFDSSLKMIVIYAK